MVFVHVQLCRHCLQYLFTFMFIGHSWSDCLLSQLSAVYLCLQSNLELFLIPILKFAFVYLSIFGVCLFKTLSPSSFPPPFSDSTIGQIEINSFFKMSCHCWSTFKSWHLYVCVCVGVVIYSLSKMTIFSIHSLYDKVLFRLVKDVFLVKFMVDQ